MNNRIRDHDGSRRQQPSVARLGDPPGSFSIEMKCAGDLYAADMGGTSDPYCRVQFAGQKVYSKTVDATLSPVWNETVALAVEQKPVRRPSSDAFPPGAAAAGSTARLHVALSPEPAAAPAGFSMTMARLLVESPYIIFDVFDASFAGMSKQCIGRYMLPLVELARGHGSFHGRVNLAARKRATVGKQLGWLEISVHTGSALLEPLEQIYGPHSESITTFADAAAKPEFQLQVQPWPGAAESVAYPGAAETLELSVGHVLVGISSACHKCHVFLSDWRILIWDADSRGALGDGRGGHGGADMTMEIPLGLIHSIRQESGHVVAGYSDKRGAGVKFANGLGNWTGKALGAAAAGGAGAGWDTDSATEQCVIVTKDARSVTIMGSGTCGILYDRLKLITHHCGERRIASALLKKREVAAMMAKSAGGEERGDGPSWVDFSMAAEVERQLGAGNVGPEGVVRRVDEQGADWGFCETYPAEFFVPADVTEDTLRKSGEFRSRQRVPAMAWHERGGTGAVYRCAQPQAGIGYKHCEEDEALVSRSVRGHDVPLTIFDCRGHLAAEANRVKGKGTEDIARYQSCAKEYCNIGNIHTMRESVDGLVGVLLAASAADREETMLADISRTQWLNHCRLVMAGSVAMAAAVNRGAVALVHCSDGWDRTSQLSALSKLLVDPFYRTIAGFRLLVQTEWLAFGHMFGKRNGTAALPNERSPCFLQWLDAVHQCVSQQPNEFEFTIRFLRELAIHSETMWFGDFLASSDKERAELFSGPDAPLSIWSYLMNPANKFANPSYAPDSGRTLLVPRVAVCQLRLWTEYFCCFDRSTFIADDLVTGVDTPAVRLWSGSQSLGQRQLIVQALDPAPEGKSMRYSFALLCGGDTISTFSLRYSSGLDQHERLSGKADALRSFPGAYPPKHLLQNMNTDPANVQMRASELRQYFEDVADHVKWTLAGAENPGLLQMFSLDAKGAGRLRAALAENTEV